MLRSHTVTYLLGCLKSQTLTSPEICEDVEKQLPFTAGGNAEKCSLDSLAVSYKTKCTFSR